MAQILHFPDQHPLAEIPKHTYVETRITDHGVEYTYHAETYEDLERLRELVRRG